MKNQLIKNAKGLTALILTFLVSVATYAQDKGLNIDIDLGGKPVWYEQTWVWVVGAAVFVLILVALLRNNSKTKSGF
jgi:hypothetical protein